MATFEDFQNAAVSEKTGIVILESSKRVVGWTLNAGAVYWAAFTESQVIRQITEAGIPLTEKTTLVGLVAGSWFYDRSAGRVYVWTTGGVNPNGVFVAAIFQLQFSNVPMIAPWDLGTGFDVEFLPLLKSVSEFGVELENRFSQLGISVEGDGSIVFLNDKAFWGSRYDRLTWENQQALVYSWSRSLPITEARMIYSGRVSEKTWSNETITFRLKDQLASLRQPLALGIVGDLPGIRVPLAYNQSRLRQVYGQVNGLVPQNLDQVLEAGYTLPGTLTAQSDGKTILGSGTAFLSQLRPSDVILCADLVREVRMSVENVVSDTELTISAELTGPEIAFINASQYSVLPNLPKIYTNRIWKVAGHALARPSCTVTAIAGVNLYTVSSVQDFGAGDPIESGGIVGQVAEVAGTKLRISGLPSLSLGATIQRVTIPVVRISRSALTYPRDYSFNAATAVLTLDEEAEFNIAPIVILSGSLTFKAGSRQVIGTDTAFSSQLHSNSWVQDPRDPANFVPVFGIISDTELYLAEDLGLGGDSTQTNVQAKRPAVFNGDEDVLTCQTLGATEDGLTTGRLIKTAPQAVKDLLTKAGLATQIDAASFPAAEELAPHEISLFLPDEHSSRSAPQIRDLIGRLNRSVFGSLVQTNDFKLAFKVIRPIRKTGIKQFLEPDVLGFSIVSDAAYLTRKFSVQYDFREYDPETKLPDYSVEERISEKAEFLAGNQTEQIIESCLLRQDSARVMAGRWSLMFELSQSILKIQTKMQGARMALADPAEIQTRFVPEARGQARKPGVTTVAKKTFLGSSVEVDELGGACSRVACIVPTGSPDWTASDDDARFYGSFVTDSFGMQANDPETFDENLIW